MHVTALRVQAAHDVLDRAVLSSGVHRLQNNQESIVVLGVEAVLHVGQLVDPGSQNLTRLVLFEAGRNESRVEILQGTMLLGSENESFAQVFMGHVLHCATG